MNRFRGETFFEVTLLWGFSIAHAVGSNLSPYFFRFRFHRRYQIILTFLISFFSTFCRLSSISGDKKKFINHMAWTKFWFYSFWKTSNILSFWEGKRSIFTLRWPKFKVHCKNRMQKFVKNVWFCKISLAYPEVLIFKIFIKIPCNKLIRI